MDTLDTFQLITSDQYPITVTKFVSKEPNGNVILINCATGVKQSFYYHYAKYLAAKGYAVYTYDYRGIGQSKPSSLRGFRASMRDWAQKDFVAVTNYLSEHHPSAKKYVIGHSIGGIFIGLSGAFKEYDAFVSIAAQYAYWKTFNLRDMPLVLWFFYISIPVLSYFVGFYPSKIKQLGEPLPTDAAMDWRMLITNPKSIIALAEKSENHYPEIKKPILIMSVEDDWMATKSAVDLLAGKAFPNARAERRHILVSESGAKAIGHVGFFRKRFENTLWDIPLKWLEQF